MNLAFVSRERRDKQISVDRESYGYVTEADFWEVGAGHIYEVSVLRPLKYQRRTTPPLQSISLEIQPSRCSLFPSSAKAVETIILREPYLVDAFGSGFGCRLLAEG